MQLKTIISTIAVVAIYLSTGCINAGAQAQSSTTSAADTLDSFIMQHMDEAGIVGLGATIIVDREVVWMKGYGFADRERGVPFTPNTVMNIGSISKTFTGVALMHAVQEGKLSLDDDINTYLPFDVINPHHPDAKITLRHLATHTSGIRDRWSVYEDTYHYGGEAPEPLGEFLESYFVPGGTHYSPDTFLDVRPGTYREYANIGAGLASYIVEVAVGERLNEYARRHIFAPLRMDDTGWSLSEIEPGDHSKLYVAQYGLTIPIPLYRLTSGGVRTSVSDLSRFFIALLNEGEYEGARILEEKSVEEMLRLQYTESNKPDNVNPRGEDSVNSGIFWATKFDVTRIGHNGTDPGMRTWMLSDLDKEVGVILFENTSLSGEERRYDVAIFLELWKYAEALRDSR